MPRSRQPKHPDLVVAYLRVSTGEQAESGAGLAAQRAAIEAEVERRGWTLAEVFTDAGASGKSMDRRPALKDALAAVESGSAGGLVVSKMDRLSRSLLDFAALIERAQLHGWNVIALDLGIDLSTPAGEFLASVMASAAQWEPRIISQRTKDALSARRASGVQLGRRPSIPPHVRQRIVAERESGNSYVDIAAGLNRDSIPPSRTATEWSPSTVRKAYLAAAAQQHATATG